MRRASTLEVIQRHRWVIILTFLIFVVVTAAVSKSLTKIYSTDASLLVSLPADTQSFDTVQASQSLARSYTEIIDSPTIAAEVTEQLGDGVSVDDLLGAMSFEQISETQLILITAEDPSPEQAREMANTYAEVFSAFTGGELEEVTQGQVTVADPAPLPTSPARPKPTIYTIVAGLLGLGLGLGLAFLREQLDRRIRSFEDVEARFELPVLARIPPRGRSDASVQAFSEAFRMLRTNLQFVRPDVGLRSVALTSGRASEGKTTASAQLALAASEVGLKVAVVEGDLRRPGLQNVLLPKLDEPLRPGLSNYLVEAASLDEVLHKTGRPNLWIVPAGPLPPSPSSLLEISRGPQLLSALLERVDMVILDTPPISIGADAMVMSNWVDGVVLLVDLQNSTDHGVANALSQIEAVHATALGLVVNRDKGATAGGYGYYRYYSEPEGNGKRGRGRRSSEQPRAGSRPS